MSLVVAPLGVGLGAVAPTIVHAFFDARWAGMASMLAVLSVMTIIQPAPWSAVAYLQAEKMTRPIAIGSITRVIVLLGSVIGLGYAGGPVWACAGVGIGFGVYSIQMVFLTAKVTKLSAREYFISTARPLFATVPMFFAVTGLRYLMASVPVAVTLTAEIVAGAVVYIAFTFVLARKNVQELLQIVRRSPA
jgi:PST family polysaccharide transporter